MSSFADELMHNACVRSASGCRADAQQLRVFMRDRATVRQVFTGNEPFHSSISEHTELRPLKPAVSLPSAACAACSAAGAALRSVRDFLARSTPRLHVQ